MLVCSPFSSAVLAMLLLLLTLEDLLQQLPALAGALARLGLALVGTIGVRLELSHLLQDRPDDVRGRGGGCYCWIGLTMGEGMGGGGGYSASFWTVMVM